MANRISNGLGIENAALKALTRLGLNNSSDIPFGGINGLIINGTTEFLPGVNTCRSGIASIIARYSAFVGSIAINGNYGNRLLNKCSTFLLTKSISAGIIMEEQMFTD